MGQNTTRVGYVILLQDLPPLVLVMWKADLGWGTDRHSWKSRALGHISVIIHALMLISVNYISAVTAYVIYCQ